MGNNAWPDDGIAIYNPNMTTALSLPEAALSPRRKSFLRESPLPSQPTDRDIHLIGQVPDHRFVRSTHLSELTQAPHKKICERLTCLFHAGYLDRPRAQFEVYRPGGGSTAMVYALGRRGAALLCGSPYSAPFGSVRGLKSCSPAFFGSVFQKQRGSANVPGCCVRPSPTTAIVTTLAQRLPQRRATPLIG